jgi:hypothetical protein
MMASTSLNAVNDANLARFLDAEWAVLILSKTGCGYCASYQRDIEVYREQGLFEGISIGKLVLNEAGASQFKRDNRWLADLTFLPHTLLYHQGRVVDSFGTSRGSYLLERLEDGLGNEFNYVQPVEMRGTP